MSGKQLFPKNTVPNSTDITEFPKQLFPSASGSATQDTTVQSLTEFPAAFGQTLDWLENKSFNTEDAVAIAKFHTGSGEQKTHPEKEEYAGTHEEQPQGFSEEEHISRKRRKDSHKHSHHFEGKTKSHKKHKSYHKHSTKYGSGSEDSQRRHHSKKKKKHRKHKHDSKRSHQRSSTSSDGSNDMSSSQRKGEMHEDRYIQPKATWLDELVSGTAGAYYLDNKPDKNNLCFDSLHFTDTAFYRRLGKSCLGLATKTQKISWWTSKEKQSKKHSSKSDADRYFGKGRVSFREEGVHVVLPQASDPVNASSVKPVQSFISLESESTKSNPSEVDPLGVYDALTNQYISGQQQSSNTWDSKQSSAEALQNEERSFKSKQVTEFNKYLHENPHDIQKWLEFVKFQDTGEALHAASVGEDSEMERKKKKKYFVLEKKQAILEKALKVNPNNIKLQLAELELNRELWSEPELIKQWEKVLKSHPDDISLWREYILFNQSVFSTFSMSKAVSLYEKCFEALQSAADQNQQSDGSSALTDETMDMFVQQCQLWRQTGHTEKAVAAFQAMVELNCFCPDNLEGNTKLKGQVAFLETFWDSDEPRFGEKDAKGWKTWMMKKEKGGWEEVPPQNTANTEDDDETSQTLDSSKPLWQVWLQEEISREQSHLLPWRPDTSKGETEEDCEDPERMVLFDDISSILFKIQSQQEKYTLILRFLEFLGVNTALNPSSSSQTTPTSFHLTLEHPRQVSLDDRTSGMCHPIHNPGSGSTLHCNGLAFNCTSLDSRSETVCQDLQDIITNVFTQSIALFKEPVRTNLLVLWLQHELGSVSVQQRTEKQQKKQVKAARKFAKKLLSEEGNRNNLLLWEVFAKWEWSLGNKEDACKMLDMGLSFAKQLTETHHKRTVAQVVSTYTELLCSKEDDNSDSSKHNSTNSGSLYILTNFVESNKYVPYKSSNPVIPSVAIIRARKIYQELLEDAMKGFKASITPLELVESCGSYIVHLARCYARFQYLTVGIQAASVVMEETLNCLKPVYQTCMSTLPHMQQNLDYELVMTSYTILVAQYVLSNPVPLNTLRNLLRRALKEFPDNPTFLQLFISVEAKSHIAGTVRRYFDHATQEAKSPIPWLCAIHAEKQRQLVISKQADIPGEITSLPETGVSNRIRSLFDRAVSHKASRHCILLWRLYIQFEVHQGNIKRAQAIFYQALQHCPWAKVLYVDAVRFFPEKLQDFHDLLMEKELRIRAPIEEIELLVQG
ncbi:nuclear exosome regulator NRDE2-like [Amphiura filiformis]|uniref:nuclear exosome regulator NRDE2-like n=1 Tax=Amphiura filiformis TaxID=82378 RepID=UPI003B221CF9